MSVRISTGCNICGHIGEYREADGMKQMVQYRGIIVPTFVYTCNQCKIKSNTWRWFRKMIYWFGF